MTIRFTYIGRAVRPVDITVTQGERDGASSTACREATGEYYYGGSWRAADKGSTNELIGKRVEFERLGLGSHMRTQRRFPRWPSLRRRRAVDSSRTTRSLHV